MSITYAAPSLEMPIALRTKLRPWKNRIKKIHMNAKELSLLGGCGGGERERERGREGGEEGEREREREGGGERKIHV